MAGRPPAGKLAMYVSTQPASSQLVMRRPMSLGAYSAARVRQDNHQAVGRLGLTASPGEQAGVKTAEVGVSLIPVVGPALAPIVGTIANLFTSSHAAAVSKEGSTLTANLPAFLAAVQQIMAALSAGSLTPAAAISALQSAQSSYYSSVSGIIKKGGDCDPSCVYSGPGTSVSRPCCNMSGTCNAACCLGCFIVEPTVANLTALIQSGGGSYTIPATPTNGAIAGTPSIMVSYGSSGISALSSSTLAGLPIWIWLLGGGLILFLLMGRR